MKLSPGTCSPSPKDKTNNTPINTTPDLYEAAKHVLKIFHRRIGLSMSEEYALDRLYQALAKAERK